MDFVSNSPVNILDSRMYLHRTNYKELVDDEGCIPNQMTDSNNDHQQHNHYAENAQLESNTDLKYNKRIKTLIENETNGNYVSQGYQENQLTNVQFEKQNMIYSDKNDCGRSSFSNRKDMKNELKTSTTYNHLLLQDATRLNSNDDTLGGGQTNDANNLAQHFNDHLQTQSMVRNYYPQCMNKLNEMTTYQSLSNDSHNGSIQQQREQSFAKNYQKREHE